MAMTAQHSVPQHWDRWAPEQQAGPEYTVAEGPAMVPYNHQQVGLAPHQRPAMHTMYEVPPQQYQTAPTVAMAPSPFDQVHYSLNAYAPQPPLPTSGTSYERQHLIHGMDRPRIMAIENEHGVPPFTSSPVSAVPAEFKHNFAAPIAQQAPVSMQPTTSFNGYPFRQQRATFYGHDTPSPSPSVSDESARRDSAASVNPVTNHKTITTNISLDGNLQAEFHTDIDQLMKTIQAAKDEPSNGPKPDAVATAEPGSAQPGAVEPNSDNAQNQQAKMDAQRKHVCDVPECGRRFSQKTHLEMHLRSHTNTRPYVCRFPGCGKRVSQLGNLKTHERRHTGEKPYQCDQCGKRFAQRGNVRAHQNVHLNQKPFQCILDNCNKRFSQRGNLKSHQNHFHAETLRNLTTRFATIQSSETVSDEDREFLEYFAVLYKNSNKGIKGRGKACKIASIRTAPITPPRSANMSPVSPSESMMHVSSHQGYAQYPHAHMHQQMPLPTAPVQYSAPQGYYGVSHPASYSMSTGRQMMNMPPSADGSQMSYTSSFRGSFATEDGSVASTAPTLYEEEHGRSEMAFTERIY